MKFDFDRVWERRGSDCLKWDFIADELKKDHQNVLASAVSDSDFAIPGCIIDAISKRLAHPILGYSERSERYYKSVIGWYQRHYDLDLKQEWFHTTPGILPAMAMLIEITSEQDDAILVQGPVYHGISRAVENTDRALVINELVNDNGFYYIDFEMLEQQLANVKVMLFCNPHNPVGRLWTKEEVNRVTELCHRHQVMLISDEVWADISFFGGKHQSCLATNSDWHQQLAVCSSSAKTFGLTSLRLANTFIKNANLSARLKRKLSAYGIDVFSSLSMVASIAAYEDGDTWLKQMLYYLEKNITLVEEFLKQELPELKFVKPEATYLAWIDCRRLGLTQTQLEQRIVNEQKLTLNFGDNFGETGGGFIRLNLSCPRSILQQKLYRLKAALSGG